MSSRALYGTDAEGNPEPISSGKGTLHTLGFAGEDLLPFASHTLLQEILMEMRIANAYRAIAHNHEVKDTDI